MGSESDGVVEDVPSDRGTRAAPGPARSSSVAVSVSATVASGLQWPACLAARVIWFGLDPAPASSVKRSADLGRTG